MCYRNYEVDVPGTFASYFLFSYFYAASIAYDSFVTDSFVFSAMAFVIFYWTKNAFAEQSVAFRFVGSILMVSGFSTSPYEFSRISSGDAKLIVIFEKLLFILLSFLNAIFFCIKSLSIFKLLLRDFGPCTVSEIVV